MPPLTAEAFNARIADYFGAPRVIVAQEFTPATGWVGRPRFRKTMTMSWARKLRADGVTHVALAAGRRRADFTIAELLRPPRQ